MMLRGKSAMGFKSVKRVEVKAETTTPGEVRTTTDVNGVRVNTSRARRTLPKLEFVVEENGAILHGPQRGLYPFISSGADQFFSTASTAHAGDAATATGATSVRNGAPNASSSALLSPSSTGPLHPSLLREFPSVHHVSSSNQDGEDATTVGDATLAPNAVPMKDCVLNDSRATTLAIKYDNSVGKFVCGSSIERFSGHTGVCRVLGSKKYPVIPHRLQIGDLLRIGSVGLVVCELNRTTQEDGLETLTEEEYHYIKENYLSVPLQQTFRPTDPRSGQPIHGSNNQNHDGADDDGDEDVDDDVDDRRGPRPVKLRSGETSDEGESEEDAAKRLADEDDMDHDDAAVGDGGGARRRALRLKDGLVNGREKRFCYICYDGDEEPDTNPLVAPCNCKGDTKFVHLECLQRWNNNLDADGSNPNHKMCAVTNTDGLDVCSICKATYLTSVRLEDGRVVSLMAKKLPPPYVTFAVVTQHETRSRSTALTNTRFQLSFANLPRGQQFLTIGRSTTNNMTLRYRTVSQLHAKIKFEDNEFHLHDASSSNGTMLFLSKPVELEWNKVVHVKIGRTILTLKPKKRWKWSGGADGDDEVPMPTAVDMPTLTSPKPDTSVDDGEAQLESQRRSSGTNRFEIQSSALSDPSAELLSSPYAAVLRQPLNRTFTAPFPYSSHQFNPIFPTSSELDGELENIRLSDLLDDGGLLAGRGRASSSSSAGGGFVGTPRRVADTRASFGDVPSRLGDLGLTTRLADRRETRPPSFDYMERLSQMTLGSPRFLERMSAPDRFDRA